MIRRSLYGVLVALLSVVDTSASAQTRGSHFSDRDIKIGQPVKKPGPSARKPCPEFGPGFVRVAGSSSCVRIGGGIGIDAGTGR